ncbi:hypothetical protein L1787_17365 [Acuticoccus sp. M5D2P5]|uniref:hypothetical protein n=1 Tax=Acuticoccus kalidii TaxID=2910977 RepID=UPI001F45C4EB|nr:hypothetical protein [Acuticoccus kalidii]MCF3935170.1 hypothetical protein [Acuticoccus kalidii]
MRTIDIPHDFCVTTRRRWLVGAAATVAGTQALASASPADAAPQRDVASCTPHQAIGDGASHPLSERYQSLEAARADFPAATSLDDEIDWCAIQSALDATARTEAGGGVYLPNTGAAYVLNRGLRLNPARTSVYGDGTRLDFTRLPEKSNAVHFAADSSPQYGHERTAFQGFELIGPGRASTYTAGLFFHTDLPAHSSRTVIRDCAIHGFYTGILMGDRAYIISFDHISVYHCRSALDCPYDLEDAGEGVSFNQSALFNCENLVVNTAGFELRFVSCSLDYCERVVWDNNGIIDFVSCRIEIRPPSTPPFHIAVGRIDFFGGFFLINGKEPPKVDQLFAFNDPGAAVHMTSLRGWNWKTTSGRLTKGPGKIYWVEGREIDMPPGRTWGD